MDRLKGGEFLLDALPRVRHALGRPLELSFAGDGPERDGWERKAAAFSNDSGIAAKFAGWLDRPALDRLFQSTDLLVFPSVWPEPFGLTGLEAGLYGIPTAAFATGGVREWLADGVNGFAAPGDRPRPGELADTIVKCLQDGATYQRLSEGAIRVAKQFNMDEHLRELIRVFERARA
jgi:glycosyltransferase involved in cell wall biosynthesis